MLPWSWAAERLARSHDYWVATVRPDGSPHVMPVEGVWMRDMLWFSSSGRSRRTRNLAENPHTVMTTDDPKEPVVVEGEAERVESPDEVAAFVGAVNAKYGTDYPVDFFLRHACFRVRPVRAFGLAESDFTGTPTRWRFD